MFNGRAGALDIPGAVVLAGNRQDGAGHAQSRQNGNVFDPAPIPMAKETKKKITGNTMLRTAMASGLTIPTYTISMTLNPV